LKSFTQPSGLIAEHLSHDRRVAEMYKSDPLVHNRISAGLFHSAISASTYITSNIPHLKKPVLLLHGSGDLITSHAASRKLASENRNITLKIWEGGYHELHNETFRDEVFTEIIGWMNTHI
jgi:alpha-beta hydrolase superfamily lysophospholipase